MVTLIVTDSRRVVVRGWGTGNGELVRKKHRVAVLQKEKSPVDGRW